MGGPAPRGPGGDATAGRRPGRPGQAHRLQLQHGAQQHVEETQPTIGTDDGPTARLWGGGRPKVEVEWWWWGGRAGDDRGRSGDWQRPGDDDFRRRSEDAGGATAGEAATAAADWHHARRPDRLHRGRTR